MANPAPNEVILAVLAAEQQLTAARIRHVRDICAKAIDFDGTQASGTLTDRQWLAQSVLNILDGKIDKQIAYEQDPCPDDWDTDDD
jgi:hypothetical protein